LFCPTLHMCMCVCARACVCACVRVRARACTRARVHMRVLVLNRRSARCCVGVIQVPLYPRILTSGVTMPVLGRPLRNGAISLAGGSHPTLATTRSPISCGLLRPHFRTQHDLNRWNMYFPFVFEFARYLGPEPTWLVEGAPLTPPCVPVLQVCLSSARVASGGLGHCAQPRHRPRRSAGLHHREPSLSSPFQQPVSSSWRILRAESISADRAASCIQFSA
jgi:hypothetical protein